jgi:hypothetical protein
MSRHCCVSCFVHSRLIKIKCCFAFGVKQAIVRIKMMLDGKLANNLVSNVLRERIVYEEPFQADDFELLDFSC